MSNIKRFFAYGTASILGILGLNSPEYLEARNYNKYEETLSLIPANTPIYFGNNKILSGTSAAIFSDKDLDFYAHYSHRSHRSHSSHSSHQSHYSHYSGTGGSSSGGYSGSSSSSVYQSAVIVDKMAIVDIQNRLNILGYECGVADGIKGDKTTNAIKSFQLDYSLDSDGIVGDKTKSVLESINFLVIQKKLNALGYSCVPTGVRDNQTVGAIKKFQTDKGLVGNGIVNKKTLTMLGL